MNTPSSREKISLQSVPVSCGMSGMIHGTAATLRSSSTGFGP